MIELLDSLQTLLHFESRGMTVGFIFGILHSIYIMTKVFIFNYHFYIDHGTLIWPGEGDNINVNETAVRLGHKPNYMYGNAYPIAFIISLIVVAAWSLAGMVWYVTFPIIGIIITLFVPSWAIRHIAKDKRNKVVFEQTLDGTLGDSK